MKIALLTAALVVAALPAALPAMAQLTGSTPGAPSAVGVGRPAVPNPKAAKAAEDAKLEAECKNPANAAKPECVKRAATK